jgi:hypothetical protein
MTVQQAIDKGAWLYNDYSGVHYKLLSLRKGLLKYYKYYPDIALYHGAEEGINGDTEVKRAFDIHHGKILKSDPPLRGIIKAVFLKLDSDV